MQALTEQYALARRMVPLLRSIAREIRDRNRSIASAEMAIEDLSGRGPEAARAVREELARLWAQRRHLERVERELTRLGWCLDQDHPLRMQLRGPEGTVDLTWRLEDTAFRPAPADARR